VGEEYDILASATQENGIITLTSIDIMMADQVLEILLHIFGWDNIKWIMIGECARADMYLLCVLHYHTVMRHDTIF
jgi:hypothetical protein